MQNVNNINNSNKQQQGQEQQNSVEMYWYISYTPEEFADFQSRVKENEDDGESLYLVGHCLYWGTGGVAEDEAGALPWFERAARHKSGKAQWRLGHCHQYGRGGLARGNWGQGEQWYCRAVPFLQMEAALGDAEAQYLLGICSSWGKGGLPVDKQEAFERYQSAAERGHASAECELGECYQFGWGVPRDLVKAVELFESAASKGHLLADSKRRHLERGLEPEQRREVLSCLYRNARIKQIEQYILRTSSSDENNKNSSNNVHCLGLWSTILARLAQEGQAIGASPMFLALSFAVLPQTSDHHHWNPPQELKPP